jgi:hypothetical protein
LELVAGTGTTSNPMFPNKSSIPPVLFATAGGAEDGTLGAASPKKPSLGWLAEEATMMQHTWDININIKQTLHQTHSISIHN